MGKISKNNNGIYIAAALSILGTAVMIIFPEVSLTAAKKGLSLWAYTVVPALLPFFICANLMIRLGVPQKMAKYFERPVRRFFNVPGSAAFAFIMSITSGYPMGAKITAEMRQQKLISKSDGERMMTFCSTSGPLFMLGAVGAGMLGSVAAGWVIAISHYTSAVFNGMIFRGHGINREERTHNNRINRIKDIPAAAETGRSGNPANSGGITGAGREYDSGNIASFTADSIFSSFRTLLLIGGYIVIFTLVVDFLEAFSFFAIIPGQAYAGMVKGFFEFTVGCSAVAAADIAILTKCAICTAIISWGGLSTHFQVASIMSQTDIDMGFYIRTKLCHAILASMVAVGMGSVLFKMADASAAVFANVFATDMVNGSANMLSSFSAKITEISVSTGGAIAAVGISRETFIAAQMFVNRLLFSSQMIIIVIVIFVIITLLGRMSYEITSFIKRFYLRRKNAARKRKESRKKEAVQPQ